MLLVDIGNTRIKSALWQNGALVPWPALPTAAPAHFADWPQDADGAPHPRRALVSNVAGPNVAAALVQHVYGRWGVEAEFVEPRRSFAGMTTDYAEPQRLGVDRWLAALAAWHATRAAVCVVDLGTALTVDVVTAAGRHLGGLIAPGMDLMRESLSRGTAQLPRSEAHAVKGFATNTADAIALGCGEAVAGLLGRVRTRLAAQGEADNMAWFVTGGGAEAVLPMLGWPCRHDPDLVLRGLVVVAENGA